MRGKSGLAGCDPVPAELIKDKAMSSASLLAEAIKNNETLQNARERIEAHSHVAAHYRAIAMPALAAVTRRVAAARKAREISRLDGMPPLHNQG